MKACTVGYFLDKMKAMDLAPLIAHRGLSSLRPENTWTAFEAAVAAGLTWIETDVTLLGDGTAVLSHDYRLGRCTSIKKGCLGDYTVADLKNIDVGSWFAPQYADQCIPLLKDFLIWSRTKGVGINLEIKVEFDNLSIWNALVEEIARQLIHFPQEQLLISSFHLPLLYRCRQLLPEVRLAYLLFYEDPYWQGHAEQLKLFSLNVHHTLFKTELLNRCLSCGYKLLIYTVNEKPHIEWLLKNGVAAIFSDTCPTLT